MIKTVVKAVEPAERQARFDHIQPHYLEALTLIERLHRRLLDVIKDEFDRRGRADINAVQALLLFNVGDKELNYQLGLERAEAVKRYLYAQHQIPLHKINVISYGESKPVSPNKTRTGRAENRRIVVRVLS